MAIDAPKVYEIGLDAQRIEVDEVRYFIEPASVPLEIEKFKDFGEWQVDRMRSGLPSSEVRNKRVIGYYELSTKIGMPIYFQYNWATPLDLQKFVVIDSSGSEIDTDVVRDLMLISSAYLPAGHYKIIFIAEPKLYSDVRLDFTIMNPAQVSGAWMKEIRFRILIYGIGLAFIFFNLSMFLLHRRLYFIYYVGYSLTILFPLAVGSADVPMGSTLIWNFSIIFNCLFTVLMSSSVLRLREFQPVLIRFTFILWVIAAGFLFLRYFLDSRMYFYIGMAIGIVCYLICMFSAVRRMQAGYIPATFFALGWGVLAFGYALNYVAMFFIYIPGLTWSAYIAYALESLLFAVALAYRTRDSEQRAVEDRLHALSQLQKVIYPHQMQQITNGHELEGTMPTTSGHACVISFDIIGSSKIKHIRSKEFFRNVFTRCNAIMSEGYDGKSLKANAYRVKEMGDGFLCSVGYPFQSMTVNSTNEAIDLARRFAQVLHEEAAILHSETPIACGIGIALDTLTGFYPEAGTKEYDIYGHALVLATRYEGMRKILFEAEKGRSVLIIQEVVYQSLDPSHRAGFSLMDLKELGVVVRDDPAATKLYYQFLDQQQADEKPATHLKAV